MSLDVWLFTKDIDGNEVEVFSANITHNLGRMAEEAGIYEVVWRPEEHGLDKAGLLVEILEPGIALMKAEPERFKRFDAPNGWGTYKDFLPWLERYLEACKQYPSATIHVSR